MCVVASPSASVPLPSVRLRLAHTTIGRAADITPIHLAIEFARLCARACKRNEMGEAGGASPRDIDHASWATPPTGRGWAGGLFRRGFPSMEREPDHKHRLAVASRLYNALCAQYPDRFITFFDENGARVSGFNQPDTPVK
jgi:hypothetical protein